MPNTSVSNTARRALDHAGQTINLTNYTADNTTERVQTWNETTNSPHSITARVNVRTQPRVSRDMREEGDVDIDATVFIPDDASGVSGIRDGGGQGASVIDVDQDGTDDYRVLVNNDQDNGVIRLACERID